MSGADLVDSLNQFMRGSDWQESIQIFVEANCSKFKDDSSSGFTHEQFHVWKNFQEIVESILASALDDTAGCTMEDFERALDDLSREPAAGPREGVKREILSQLLTYADFNDFSDMMHVAITYQYPEKAEPVQCEAIEACSIDVREDNRTENRVTLLQLSFPRDAVDHVIDNSVMDSSLDYLIDQLHSMHPTSSDNDQRGEALCSDIPVDELDRGYGLGAAGVDGPAQQERLENECINAFAQESLQDSGELRAKFVIALSVLDSVESGDVSEGVLEQLTWASSMCNLFQEMVTSFSTGVPFELYNFTHAKGLLNWFDTLDKQFSSLKMGAYTGTGMSEQELRRIVALEDLAAMGTEDERLLHGLISRHEEVLKELSRQHGKCILMTSATTKGTRIKREHLEELYLYLKEQVNSGTDLTAVSDEMFGQVSKLVSSEVSTDAVNLLLEIHVLEDEQILLKRQIMALLRDPSAAKEESADDEIQEISLFGSKNRPADGADRGERKEDKDRSEFKSPERKAWGDDEERNSSVIPETLCKPGYSLPPIVVSPGKEYRGIKQEIKDLEDKESLEASRLAKIREQHRNGLKQLLSNLQDQKARAIRAMEAKMARRQKGDGNVDQAGKNTRNILEGGVDGPQDEVTPLSLDEFSQIEEALVAGYKRRCVQETRLASENGGVVTSKVIEQAKENAAGELKRRHEEELRKLMEELAHDRQKERNRIKDMLYTRRQNNKNVRNSTALQAEEDRLLKEFERDYDAKEAKTLSEVQRQACISLAAVITSESTDRSSNRSVIDILTGGDMLGQEANSSTHTPAKRKEKESEEENYFDSPSGKGSSSLSPDDVEQWLMKLREYTSAYGAIGSSLVQKAKTSNGNTTNEVPSKVLRVVLNACENDLNDAGANFLYFSDGKRQKIDNMESIKARVLDEFERSRLKAEVDKARAGEESKSRLRKRRDHRKRNSNLGDDGIETIGDSEEEGGDDDDVLASAVDQLMDESTEETFSSVVNIYDQSMPDYTKTSRNGNNYRTEADKSEKEKMIASEREHKKELTDDLYAQMAMRKGNLEERLRQKKAKYSSLPYSIAADSKDTTGVAGNAEDAKDEDEDKLKKLELAFGLVTELVQGSNSEELKKMDLDSLLALIEHATKVKQGDVAAGVKYPAPAQVTGNNNYREGYDDILKDIDALLGSRGPGGLPMLNAHEEREQKQRYKEHMDGIMQNTAKNLSSQYNVEKEKYDLRMKIEQARQQQTLQRKLLERRQSNANRSVPSTGGAGYSSVAAGNLLAGMMSHAANSKSGSSPVKKANPDSAAALKSRGLSTSNLFRK